MFYMVWCFEDFIIIVEHKARGNNNTSALEEFSYFQPRLKKVYILCARESLMNIVFVSPWCLLKPSEIDLVSRTMFTLSELHQHRLSRSVDNQPELLCVVLWNFILKESNHLKLATVLTFEASTDSRCRRVLTVSNSIVELRPAESHYSWVLARFSHSPPCTILM